MLSTRRDLIVLTVAAAAIFCGAVLAVWPETVRTRGASLAIEDSPLYKEAAEIVARHGLFEDDLQATFHARARMPAYPLALLGCDRLSHATGIEFGYWALALNAALWIVAVRCVYGVVAQATQDRRIAFATAGSLILTPGLAPYLLAPMPEALLLALGAGSAWWLVRSRHWTSGATAGLLAGLGVLAKPVALPLAGLAWLAVLLRDGVRHPRRALVFGAVVGCVVGAWVFRNWVVWDCVTLTPNGGSHAYHYLRAYVLRELGRNDGPLHPLTHAHHETRVPTDAAAWHERYGFPYDNLGKRHLLLGQLAGADIRENFGAFLAITAKQHPRLYFGTGTQAMFAMAGGAMSGRNPADPNWLWRSGWWIYQGATLALLAGIYIAALRGVWFGLRRPTLRPALLLTLSSLAILAVLVGPFWHTRYRVPMMPFFAVLAGVGLTVGVGSVTTARSPTRRTQVELPAEAVATER